LIDVLIYSAASVFNKLTYLLTYLIKLSFWSPSLVLWSLHLTLPMDSRQLPWRGLLHFVPEVWCVQQI